MFPIRTSAMMTAAEPGRSGMNPNKATEWTSWPPSRTTSRILRLLPALQPRGTGYRDSTLTCNALDFHPESCKRIRVPATFPAVDVPCLADHDRGQRQCKRPSILHLSRHRSRPETHTAQYFRSSLTAITMALPGFAAPRNWTWPGARG